MIKYKNIFFDLDGTITNSYNSITKSVLYALDKLRKIDKINIKPLDESVLIKFIGPPLEESLIKYCDIKDKTILNKALLYYRENYTNKTLFDCPLYDGIYETMEILKQNGCNLFLATAKPRDSAVRIIDYFNITPLLNDVYAALLAEGIKNKKDVLELAMSKGNFEARESVMIGDRIDDVDGAKSVGMDVIAATYGFGEPSEFIEADYLINKPTDILDIILKD